MRLGKFPIDYGKVSHYLLSMNTLYDDIITDIEAYCSRHGIKPTTFGRKAIDDGKLFNRLKKGGGVTRKTEKRIYDFINSEDSSAT